VLHFSNVNILLIQAPHAASDLVQPLFMVGEKGVILDKLLPGFNYKAPQVHYTIKKSRTLYNQEISVCLLLIFCQLQCFAVNSTVRFYIMNYIAMYNFCLEFKHIDEKQIFTLTLAYILVAFSEVRGNSNAGSVVESFLRKVGAQAQGSCQS